MLAGLLGIDEMLSVSNCVFQTSEPLELCGGNNMRISVMVNTLVVVDSFLVSLDVSRSKW